ncbi:MAG: hypothetical protein DRQ88_11310 [Epsilonproteobacteria bacterium]|nr:MAG: hypothetical protein DRQ89_06665 [Campylobacterota bacterium]RLA64271.1 MAG: hypothetical protein DRQ88_11310 [Campylobacterota bacterium]
MVKIFDFQKKREEVIEEKRQGLERIMFKNVLGAYAVIEENGDIYPITLNDISQDGVSFEVPYNEKVEEKFSDGAEIKLRMYFSKHSFIPIIIKIRHSTEILGFNRAKFIRYGCEFDKSLTSFKAMQSFIDFLYQFAEFSTHDHGENKAFFI